MNNIIIIRNPWSHQFCHSTFNDGFGLLRIFQLVTDGYTLTCTDKFWQISLQRMMRKTCQSSFRFGSISSLCLYDP
ncbi:hypothetical protein D3C86_1836390 [compost metagenome]